MTPLTEREAELSAEGTESESPSRGTLLAVYGGYLVVLTVLFLGSAELIVRARGFKPWQAEDAAVSSIQVEPGGKFFQKHSELGYSHIPGRFAVTLGLPPSRQSPAGGEQSLRFTVTHLPNGLRITHRLETYGSRPEPADNVWIFGCSFTHGWSVNDDQTYPWVLQQRFPEAEVVNFGVSGYGTVHSLLQFREALKTKTPKVAVLAYADFHDVRNTFSRERRKLIAPWNRLGPLVQPYARLDKAGALHFQVADVEYREFPFMRYSALSHFLETRYDELEPRWLQSRAVSQALIVEMAELARQHQVTFAVATINGPLMTDFFAAHHIANLDLTLDFKRPENTNLPFDSHPSAVAHAQYADRLETFIKSGLTGKN